ncbi:TIR domain-containing protein [Kitasatospora sp. NPDC056531]|uniref:TIR domain-containing protein n=1 Tax=Kitasatospora sp. NPDC056531 TaxID=3345856 RepID=UPI0036AC9970
MKKSTPGNYRYDVALSFAGEQRPYVSAVAKGLRKQGVLVFYDDYEKADLLGRHLYEHLDRIYRLEAEYCVIFASSDYARKVWTTHERRSAQSRALVDHSTEYILPARFDDTEIPGLAPDVGYIDLRTTKPAELVKILIQKIIGAPDVEHMRAALLAAKVKISLSPGSDLARPAIEGRVDRLKRRLAELGETPTISSPGEALRLIEEYVFSREVRRWPGSLQSADYALETVRQFMSDPVLIGGKRAALSLNAAEGAHRETEAEPAQGDDWKQHFRRVEEILKPVLEVLPAEEEYNFAVGNISPAVAVSAIERGYYRSIADRRGDLWSWNYLLLLAHLGERDALLKILKARLKVEDPLDKAYVATRELARDVLGDDFPIWFRDEVMSPDEEDPWPDGRLGL